MSIAYKFEVQLSFHVVIEDDSNTPLTKAEARRCVIENLNEHVDSADTSECLVSEGIEMK